MEMGLRVPTWDCAIRTTVDAIRGQHVEKIQVSTTGVKHWHQHLREPVKTKVVKPNINLDVSLSVKELMTTLTPSV